MIDTNIFSPDPHTLSRTETNIHKKSKQSTNRHNTNKKTGAVTKKRRAIVNFRLANQLKIMRCRRRWKMCAIVAVRTHQRALKRAPSLHWLATLA